MFQKNSSKGVTWSQFVLEKVLSGYFCVEMRFSRSQSGKQTGPGNGCWGLKLGVGGRETEKRDRFGVGRLAIADGLDEDVREREGSWRALEFVGPRGWAVDMSILEMQGTVEERACG